MENELKPFPVADPDEKFGRAIAHLRALDAGQGGYLDEIASLMEELLGAAWEAREALAPKKSARATAASARIDALIGPVVGEAVTAETLAREEERQRQQAGVGRMFLERGAMARARKEAEAQQRASGNTST